MKWQLNRPGTWVYPSIGVTATDGDVIAADYAIDVFWEQVDDATPATIPPPNPILPPYSETPDGAFLVYSRAANNFVPSVVAPFDELGRLSEEGVPERLTTESLDVAYVRNSAVGALIDSRISGHTITVSDAPHGAKGDGTTDDTAAWASVASAVASGSPLVTHTVIVPPGTYPVNSFPTLPNNVRVVAERGTATIKLTGSVARFLDLNDRTNVTLDGLRIDFNGLITSAGIRMGTNSNKNNLIRCTFTSSAPTPTNVYAVDFTDGAVGCNIIDCDLVNLLNPCHVRGAVTGVHIDNNRVTGFGNRGIFVISTATAGTLDVSVCGNTLSDAGNFRTVTNKVLSGFVATLTISGNNNPYTPGMPFNVQGVGAPFDGLARTVTAVSGMNVSFALNEADVASTAVTKTTNYPPSILQDGDPRQPITVQNGGILHEGLRVNDNTLVGNDGVAHHLTLSGDPESGALLGGTADAISVHGGSGFTVNRNIIRNSGEVGITIGNLSTAGKVSGNVVSRSNTLGIALQAVSDIDVEGNIFRSNGRELAAPSGDRTGVHNAVWVKDVAGASIVNNRCIDDQGTPTQKNVLYLAGTNTDIELGHNPRRLGTTALISTQSTSRAGLRFNIPPLRVKATADEFRSDTTLAPHAALKFLGLESGGIYRLDARIIYAASQGGDISLKWTGPTGATLTWVGDGAIQTATSPVGSSAGSRQMLSLGSAPTYGGAGSGVVGNDIFVDIRDAEFTVSTTAGDLGLTWAQGTTDAANPSVIRLGSWARLTRIG